MSIYWERDSSSNSTKKNEKMHDVSANHLKFKLRAHFTVLNTHYYVKKNIKPTNQRIIYLYTPKSIINLIHLRATSNRAVRVQWILCRARATRLKAWMYEEKKRVSCLHCLRSHFCAWPDPSESEHERWSTRYGNCWATLTITLHRDTVRIFLISQSKNI